MPSASGQPDGFHSVIPYLIVRDAAAAIDFYQRALGASELLRLSMPGGGVMHAEIKIGDSALMLTEENRERGNLSPQALGGTPVSLHVYCPDVDALYARATAAGCKGLMPPADMFWGDRFSMVEDPFGHRWSLAQHQEHVPADELHRRAAALFGGK